MKGYMAERVVGKVLKIIEENIPKPKVYGGKGKNRWEMDKEITVMEISFSAIKA